MRNSFKVSPCPGGFLKMSQFKSHFRIKPPNNSLFLMQLQIFHQGQSLDYGFPLVEWPNHFSQILNGLWKTDLQYLYPFNSATAVNLWLYIYQLCCRDKIIEEKRRKKDEMSVHLSQKLSLLKAGCSPQPSQFTKTAVTFISRVSLHFANDDLLFALSATEAFVEVRILKTFYHSINILDLKLDFFLHCGFKSQYIYDWCYKEKFNSPQEPQGSLKHTSCHGEAPQNI